jgi:hypothetical protein
MRPFFHIFIKLNVVTHHLHLMLVINRRDSEREFSWNTYGRGNSIYMHG